MIEPGLELLHYRLIEKVGEGGMGVVWKALDTTLSREVAIKILPPTFAEDADRRGRFEREARLLATLNHPGIAGVYGLHEVATPTGPVHFIAMELVPGEDLAERLARGPLSVEDALDVAGQVAEALETAHDQGVIHRDLKPANIKRTPEGKIKVLDLGLAKALASDLIVDPGSLSISPTVTSAGTVAGALLGTPAYMSPEQVKGKEADRRADIWAFGCVLHEMLTGKCLFAGETVSETLAAVLRDKIGEDALPDETPVSVRRLLARCLDRDHRTRLRDIGEARIALSPEGLTRAADDRAAVAGGADAAAIAAPTMSVRIPWAIAAIALILLPVALWLTSRQGAARTMPEIRAAITAPPGQRFSAAVGYAGSLSISPDGTKATFSASPGKGPASLYLRSLGSNVPQLIPDTERAEYPFWSPDSRELAFFVGGKLKKLDLDSGAAMTITAAPEARGGSWGPDGTILFTPTTQSAIHRVSSGGVLGEPVTQLDVDRGETTHRFPTFLPDGRHFLYLRASHAAAYQDPINSVWIGDTQSDETTELLAAGTQAIYSQGHLFWVREGFLMARPFSPDELAFTGEPFAIGQEVIVDSASWRGAFSVSDAGPIAFQTGLAQEHRLTWFDREGNADGTIGEAEKYDFISLSPDDRFLAVTMQTADSSQNDIWVFDIARNIGSRLTFSDANDLAPVWSPDGTRIAFGSNRIDETGKASPGIYVRETNGRGDAERLFQGGGLAVPRDWSSDGKYLAIDHGAGKADLWIVPLDGSEAFPFVAGEFDEGYSIFSPDANWIAYISNETGRYELYLTRFPSGEGKWQLSRVGADWSIGWNAAGTEIYYLDLEGQVCAVKVELGDTVVAGTPECLFETRANHTWASRSDGQRFVIGTPDDEGEDFPITLVLNWGAGG